MSEYIILEISDCDYYQGRKQLLAACEKKLKKLIIAHINDGWTPAGGITQDVQEIRYKEPQPCVNTCVTVKQSMYKKGEY